MSFEHEETEASIPDRFRRIVERHPTRIALDDADGTVTYDALDRLTNRLARAIVDTSGSGAEPIALLLDHGAPTVVAILAVLKAGKSYVALDGSAPAARLETILRDSTARVIITDARNASRAQPIAGSRHVVNVDASLGGLSDAPISTAFGADTLAAIFYTSGSTGSPKGVVRDHRTLLHSTWRNTRAYGIRPDDRRSWLFFAGYTTSVPDLFDTLLNGATLCPYDMRRLGATPLGAWIRARALTVLGAPVPLFREYLAAPARNDELATLRLVIVAGEALFRRDVERFRARAGPGPMLRYILGSTEAGLIASLALGPDATLERDVVPVGHAVEDTEILLLDPNGGERVSGGSVGQIAVRSRYLSRGYWGDPGLTERLFRPDPDGRDRRVFLTGDLGRFGSDGALEVLGRQDAQVKVRGHRVNMLDIEAALHALDTVRECAVVAHPVADGGTSLVTLVAHVVASEGATPNVSELRAALARTLPDFMIPSRIELAEALPKLPSGKLDRARLPAPRGERPPLDVALTLPRTALETRLAKIWSEVLGVSPIGVFDPFLDLGGHSLAAARIVARIRRDVGATLPMSALFEAPTLATLASRVEASRARPSPAPLAPRRADERNELSPLSSAQERLFFLDRLDAEVATYTVSSAFELRGPLRIDALRAAFDGLLERHESLRTTYAIVDGAAVQRVCAPAPAPFEHVDLRASADPRAELASVLARAARRSIDLTSDALIFAVTAQLAPETHALAVAVHHIACDATSMSILLREVSALYREQVTGEAAELAPIALQHADFARLDRDAAASAEQDAHIDYFRSRLAGMSPLLALSTDNPRPPVSRFRGARHVFEISAELTTALRTLARMHGTTPFVTLLAAFEMLLSIESGVVDMVVGTPVAGRTRVELEGLVGCFINLLVLRVDLSRDPTFSDVVARVRDATVGALAHADLPFQRLVEALRPARTLAHAPLFQVVFVWNAEAESSLSIPGVSVVSLPLESGTAKYDLTLTIAERAQTLRAELEFDVDLFEPTTIARLADRLSALLRAVVAAPEVRMRNLERVGDDERRALTLDWTKPIARAPAGVTFSTMFEAQVARTPDAVAVQFGDDTLTYRALWQRAEAVAERLSELDVPPGARVGIVIERSLDMLVSVVGALAAGVAYVPLEPAYPPDRLAFVLRATGATALLTSSTHARALAGASSLPRIEVDRVSSRSDAPRPRAPGSPDALAYVMFTSGSTGTPRGVAISASSLATFLIAMQRAVEVSADDVVAALTTLTFDIAVCELLLPLTVGARVAIGETGLSRDTRALSAWIDAVGATFVQATPTVWSTLLASDVSAHARWRTTRRLRAVSGGEPMSRALVAALVRATRVAYNAYGPTEATVYATVAKLSAPTPLGPLDASTSGEAMRPTIGRSLDSVRTVVVDAHARLVAIGAVGELCLGGPQLAVGYWDDPATTAARFVADPFSAADGERLYRTGDRCRRRADGALELVGRTDDQVKIRGVRVELAEVEAALSRCVGVAAAAVTIVERVDGTRDLEAYVALEPGADPTARSLVTELRRGLLDAMIPASFNVVERIPTRDSGKVDRTALASAVTRSLRANHRPQAPRSELESRLTRVWEAILGVDGIGLDDDFFTLGGHSLRALELHAAMERELGRRLALSLLFAAPTVRSFAASIEQPVDPRAAGRLRGSGDRPPLFHMPEVMGYGFLPQAIARRLDALCPYFDGFELPGRDGVTAPLVDVDALAAHLVAEIDRLHPHGSMRLSGYCFGGILAVEVARRLTERGRSVDLVLLIASHAPQSFRRRTRRDTLAALWTQLLSPEPEAVAVALARSARGALRTVHGSWSQRVRAARLVLRPADPAPVATPDLEQRISMASFCAQRAWRPRPYGGRVVLFRTTPRAFSAGIRYDFDDRNGWSNVIEGALDVVPVPGGHHSVLTSPAVDVLAEEVCAVLERTPREVK